MLKTIASFLLLLIVFISVGNAAEIEVPSLSDEEISQLNELATYIEQGAAEKHLLNNLRGKSHPIRALSAAILYRLDQKAYRDALQKEFSVDDYRARSRGEYNFISSDAMLEVVGRIENRYPQIEDKRILLLLAFSTFRNNNMWISTAKKAIYHWHAFSARPSSLQFSKERGSTRLPYPAP